MVGVLIVSQVRFLSEGLAAAIAREPTLRVIGLAEDLSQVHARLRDRPHAVLLDATYPGALEVASRIVQLAPRCPVVAFPVVENEAHLIAWARAGVAGYLPNTTPLEAVGPLLREMIAGRAVCSWRFRVEQLRNHAPAPCAASDGEGVRVRLTSRELEVIQLVTAGLSNKEIARKLNIGVATTKTHVHSILSKLNLRDRREVARGLHLPHAGSPIGAVAMQRLF